MLEDAGLRETLVLSCINSLEAVANFEMSLFGKSDVKIGFVTMPHGLSGKHGVRIRRMVRYKVMSRFLLSAFFVLLLTAWRFEPANAQPLSIDMLYLEVKRLDRPTLSNLFKPPSDAGLQGARLGIRDSQSTGRFLKHRYTLKSLIFSPETGFQKVADAVLAAGRRFIVFNTPAAMFGQLAQRFGSVVEGGTAVLINAGSLDDGLRRSLCQPNVFHTAPSRAMLTDALVQYLVKRQWTRLMLVEGGRAGDKKLASSFRRSVDKFRARLVSDRKWLTDADIRRNAGQEVPLFTQGADYDAVVVADEDRDFGQYFLYNTWLPRPVALSHGLRPVGWSAVVEQWGAAQLQRRFRRLAKRQMTSLDYAGWAAVRSVSAAVTRLKTDNPAEIAAYMRSRDFSLAGFKGRKLSFRSWNGQLRQPIPLVHARALVSLAPLEGFLHRRTELDTLGFDRAETDCGS